MIDLNKVLDPQGHFQSVIDGVTVAGRMGSTSLRPAASGSSRTFSPRSQHWDWPTVLKDHDPATP